jgi:carboxyl-terminal processing protease
MRAWVVIGLLGVAATAAADDRFADGEKTFARAKEMMAKRYVDDKVDDERLWRAATAGLFGIGKWDKLLSPSELAALKADLVGEVVGLGIAVSLDEAAGLVNVDFVVPGSAAARAGLGVGDKILRLDGKSPKGMSMSDVVRSIRGKAGTSVTLTILRDAAIVTRTIKRAPFVLDAVATQALPGGVALIEIRAFSEKTPALLKEALEKQRAAGVKALVIDLRDNEGGLYERMLDCAGQLLPRGTLVVTALHRSGVVEDKRTANDPIVSVPTAVLVNGMTSSGAEILAAALKQTGARVVGKRTHGKWNAQTIEELGNGWAAKFTVAVFRAPSGAMLDGKGLDPDVEVEMDSREATRAASIKEGDKRVAADAQLRAAVGLLRLGR